MGYNAHHLPGRIRYKIPGLKRHEILAVGRTLERCDDVEHVEVKPSSCSMIIHYDPAHTDIGRLGACIEAGLKSVPEYGSAAPNFRKRRNVRLPDQIVVQTVRHVGMVFGKTAFKVALEQAVRGGLNSLLKS